MKKQSKLDKEVFMMDGVELSKRLLGTYLVREYNGKKIVTRIVETEAYMGPIDKASHAYNNKRTARTETMFGPGGCYYVYLIYGMYYCLNVVANVKDQPEAVLIRALEPISGIDAISKNRFNVPYDELTSYQKKNLLNGPGKLCKGLLIDKSFDGGYTDSNDLYIVDCPEEERNFEMVTDKRINIDYAEEAIDFPWRFYIKGNSHVSKYLK